MKIYVNLRIQTKLVYSMDLAHIVPNHTALIQTTTFNNTLSNAFWISPCCNNSTVSNENVENVVNALNMPTTMPSLMWCEKLNLSTNKIDNRPIANEPSTFTISVP